MATPLAWAIIAVGLVWAVLRVNRWLSQPIVYRRIADDMADMVEVLRGVSAGSVLLARHPDSERFVQFAQRSDVLGVDELLFGFPDAPWSRSYFEELKRRLEANLTPFVVRETGRSDTTRFLEVEISGNDASVTQRAMELIKITRQALDLPADAVFEVHVAAVPDLARTAWNRRTGLEQMKNKGAIEGRIAAWSLSNIDGRLVDPDAHDHEPES